MNFKVQTFKHSFEGVRIPKKPTPAKFKVENEPLLIKDFDADAFQKVFDSKVESFDAKYFQVNALILVGYNQDFLSIRSRFLHPKRRIWTLS